MKPLVVLLIAFIASLFIFRWINGGYDVALSGRIAMSFMLLFTAIGHFAFTEGMMLMIPKVIPFKKAIVYLTGIAEIVAAITLHLDRMMTLTGWALMLFFILLLPANIYAAIHHIAYQKGTYEGNGTSYLWFRVPLQVLFTVWVYYSAVHPVGAL